MEFVNEEWISQVWNEIVDIFRREISKFKGTVQEYLIERNTNINVVGRVFFHLVENKEESYPFAFLATYSTSANHVVHFDRWWNPAVENQATDRAFRIGQTKNVMVHKFVTKGTIEEKIDLMIEEKQKLAGDIITSSGESWITELDNKKLMELFKLGGDK